MVWLSLLDAFRQLADGFRLIAGRRKGRVDLKRHGIKFRKWRIYEDFASRPFERDARLPFFNALLNGSQVIFSLPSSSLCARSRMLGPALPSLPRLSGGMLWYLLSD